MTEASKSLLARAGVAYYRILAGLPGIILLSVKKLTTKFNTLGQSNFVSGVGAVVPKG